MSSKDTTGTITVVKATSNSPLSGFCVSSLTEPEVPKVIN